MQTAPESPLKALQHKVQRKLGRCMLQLQHYEQLLKVVLAHMELAGPPQELEAIRAQNIESVQNLTLGTLVKKFTGDYMTTPPSEAKAEKEEELAAASTTGWVRFSSRIDITPEVYEERRQALAELVALRNELVHHFLEKFDLWGEDGCNAASMHLDQCSQRIQLHLDELKQSAKTMDEARQSMAAFFTSQEFKDILSDGIRSDGSVNWWVTPIVCGLRETEKTYAVAGWTELNKAIAYVGKQYPDHTPKRYGCKTWRHVIHESKLFEVRRQSNADTNACTLWYRSRTSEQELGQKP